MAIIHCDLLGNRERTITVPRIWFLVIRGKCFPKRHERLREKSNGVKLIHRDYFSPMPSSLGSSSNRAAMNQMLFDSVSLSPYLYDAVGFAFDFLSILFKFSPNSDSFSGLLPPQPICTNFYSFNCKIKNSVLSFIDVGKEGWF